MRGADKAKDSPEAALYVKAGRGETPVKISWNKKWKSHCNATSKKLLMARCQPVCPKRKKGGPAGMGGLPGRMPGKKA